jgi:cell division protease FtsH
MPPLQKRALAIHEAGHAIVDWVLLPEKRISRVSIIRRSKGVMGYMFSQEQEEIYIKRLAQYAAQIQVSLAGGQAVELVLGEKYMGLTGDVDNVRTVMYWLVGQGFFQDKIPFKVEDPFADKDVKKAANRYLERVREANFGLLRTHIGKLGELVDALVVEEEISSERVYEILGAGGGDETSN